jgi:cytochrome c2
MGRQAEAHDRRRRTRSAFERRAEEEGVMDRFFLRENSSRARVREADAARENRREIVRALSWGQLSRRELVKYGLITAAGSIASLRGLSPFTASVYAGPGWLFLTGNPEQIEKLSRRLSLYTPPDPDNPDGHVPRLLIGNEAMGQWLHGSALDNPKMTASLITRWVGGYPAASTAVKSYATAPPVQGFSAGQHLFSTKCSACHSLGGGDRVGPDLQDVVQRRDPVWLRNYIRAPDEMLQRGDPMAARLSERYRGVRMPNLQLGDDQIDDLIAFLEERRSATRP